MCESDLKEPKWTTLWRLLHDEQFDSSMEIELDDDEEQLFNQEVFIDAWGFQLNWTKAEEGWYPKRKFSYFHEARVARLKTQGLRKFTSKGYKIMDIPPSLYKVILEQRELERMHVEDCERVRHIMNCKKVINGQTIYQNNSMFIPVINELVINNMIDSKLRPVMQKWAKVDLSIKKIVYGIRRYLRGSQLLLHTDRLPTHILSAILQIDQKVDENWPLNLIDHKGQKKSLNLKPGQMLLYESASVLHGRQFPFRGDYYDNLFIHFQPVEREGILKQ